MSYIVRPHLIGHVEHCPFYYGRTRRGGSHGVRVNTYVSFMFPRTCTPHRVAVDSTVVFWGSDVLIGEATPFQICLQLSDTMAFVGRAFASLALHLSGRESDPPIVIHHEDIDTTGPVQYVDVGAVPTSGTETFSANLNWEPGASLVIGGSLPGTLPATLEVCPSVQCTTKPCPYHFLVHQDNPHGQGR
jgi:hypothetical protein